jgi:hypothetical protein
LRLGSVGIALVALGIALEIIQPLALANPFGYEAIVVSTASLALNRLGTMAPGIAVFFGAALIGAAAVIRWLAVRLGQVGAEEEDDADAAALASAPVIGPVRRAPLQAGRRSPSGAVYAAEAEAAEEPPPPLW